MMGVPLPMGDGTAEIVRQISHPWKRFDFALDTFCEKR